MGEQGVTVEQGVGGQVLDEVIEAHLPLVNHIVFQVAVNFPRHVDREELARAGTLGLVEAARRYDGAKGVPFARFAGQRIRGAMLDAVRAADWAPRSVRSSARAVERAQQALVHDLGRAPSRDEVADAMGVSTDELRTIESRVHRSMVLALDHCTVEDDGEDLRLVDTLTDDGAADPVEALEGREMRGYLRDAIRALPERHRLVVIGYFLENKTSAELARFLGVTESRISQLRSEAVAMLRDGINAQFDDAPGAEPRNRDEARKVAFAEAIAASGDWRDRLVGAAS